MRNKNPRICTWRNHTGKILNVKWSPNKRFLASGSNDTNVTIWKLGENNPIVKLQDHTGCVKALNWCPW